MKKYIRIPANIRLIELGIVNFAYNNFQLSVAKPDGETRVLTVTSTPGAGIILDLDALEADGPFWFRTVEYYLIQLFFPDGTPVAIRDFYDPDFEAFELYAYHANFNGGYPFRAILRNFNGCKPPNTDTSRAYHNALANIQGGQLDERWHLSEAEYRFLDDLKNGVIDTPENSQAIQDLQNAVTALQQALEALSPQDLSALVQKAGSEVGDNFFVASVGDNRVGIRFSEDNIEFSVISDQGGYERYFYIDGDGFSVQSGTKAGYLKDSTLRTLASLADKEFVAKGHLAGLGAGGGVVKMENITLLNGSVVLAEGRSVFLTIDSLGGNSSLEFDGDPIDGDYKQIKITESGNYNLIITGSFVFNIAENFPLAITEVTASYFQVSIPAGKQVIFACSLQDLAWHINANVYIAPTLTP